MRRLHRRNHAQPGETWDVLRTDHLRVLDAEAMICRRKCGQCRFESVEHYAVSAITDSVDVDLESVSQRPICPGANVLGSRDEQSGVGRLVAVRCQKPGAARAERAVGVALDGPSPVMAIA